MRFAYLVSAVLMGAALLPADVVYNVAVSTAAYTGQTGFLDFQLGRGPDSQVATATVGNFSGTGTLMPGNVQVAGAVTGSLPGTMTLGNTTQFNDYFEGITYGGMLSFSVTFSGPAINAPNGTAAYGTPFYFGMYNASQSPLGPNDGLGDALLIQINTKGSTAATIYNPGVKAAAATPEPGMFGLMAAGCVAGLAFVRQRRAQ